MKIKPIQGILASIALLLFIGWIVNRWGEGCSDPDFHSINNWQIQNANLDSQIIWQIRERPETIQQPALMRTQDWIAIKNDAVAIVVARGNFCNRDIVSFGLQSGIEQWRHEISLQSTILQITPLSHGYAITNHGRELIVLDDRGNTLWEYNDSYTRSLSTVYEVRDSLYIPASSRLVRVASETGEIIQQYEEHKTVGVFENILVTQKARNQLEVRSLESGEVLHRLNFDWTVGDASVPDQLAILHEDILIILKAYAPTQIEAFHLQTGERIWTIEEPFLGHPILLSGYLVVLGDEINLTIYNPGIGEMLGEIRLERTFPANEDNVEITDVWLDGSENIAILNFRNTYELIAVEIDFESLQ